MSKVAVVGVAALLGLTLLAGCQRPATPAAHAITPIHAEPVTPKYR